MIATDYVGLGALISAIGAAVVSIIVALRQTETRNRIGAVHDEIKMSNGQTIGQAVEEHNERCNPKPTTEGLTA